MLEEIEIILEGKAIKIKPNTSIGQLATKYVKDPERLIVAASVNNTQRDLNYVLTQKAKVEFIDISSEIGLRIYSKSLTFLFIRAVKEFAPDATVKVEHSLSKGFYCTLKGMVLNLQNTEEIENKMRELVAADAPFEKLKVTKAKAIEIFTEKEYHDKVRFLEHIDKDEITINKCGETYDFFYSYLVPSTGYLKHFSLKFHLPGVIIRFPVSDRPITMPKFVAHPKIASIFYESSNWAEILGIDILPALNDAIKTGDIKTNIQVAEALHEKKIANIADNIYQFKDRGNIILIAGPTSSGKTTFAQRLMVQMMVTGLKPISISTDNYFVNREDTPVDENGQYDFESLEAKDLELFNDHLTRLIQGEEIEIPTFNFTLGKREYHGRKLQIRPDQPIVIEGIHGLNEKMTYSIPKDHKFKIYISALTQLNIDNHNRIPTTVVRRIRRIVRDFQFRGFSPINTIKMWPSITRGEDKYIYPHQEEADVMFNSSLIYELAVLKPFVEPLLKAIGPEHEEYLEAQRIISFLSYFLPLSPEDVPKNSIMREFIGGGSFTVHE